MRNEIVEPEINMPYEYVLDLKERLHDMQIRAQRELHKAQARQAMYCNTLLVLPVLQEHKKKSNFSSRR